MDETLQPGAMQPVQAQVPGIPTQTSQDERTMALLAQVLQIVGWWIAPLVIFLIKRQSKFVSFHALQALLLQVLQLLLIAIGVVIWIAVLFVTVASTPATRNTPPPPAFFILMSMMWLCWMGMWVGMLVIAIIYGIKAGRGEWAEYPVLGRLVLKILKLGPGGVPL
jgi:uncharacterized Tic20 family protein